MAQEQDGLNIEEHEGIVVVRLIEDKQLVAMFHNYNTAGMLSWTNAAVNPEPCEYALLDSLALVWESRTSPVPYPKGYFDGEDEASRIEGYPGMSFSDEEEDALAGATWIPVACGPWIYFAKAGHRVKIGKAKDVTSRIATLQTGCPEKIEVVRTVLGGTTIERSFHQQFAHLRENGEWFRLEGDLARFLERTN